MGMVRGESLLSAWVLASHNRIAHSTAVLQMAYSILEWLCLLAQCKNSISAVRERTPALPSSSSSNSIRLLWVKEATLASS